jgi:hypothetical protein
MRSMVAATPDKVTPKKRRRGVRFPGIAGFSRQLGVDRVHVYRVLTGQRKSPRITSAWAAYTPPAMNDSSNSCRGDQVGSQK